MRERYAEFLSDPVVAPHAEVTVVIIPNAVYIEPEPNSTWVTDVSITKNILRFKSYFECGELNLASKKGRLEMAQNGSIENFLRVLYAWLALQNDSLLLHAAGMAKDGKGYVFFGPSGSGKSTTAGISAEITQVLSDDLVLIRHTPAGYDLCGVPFLGELSDAPRQNLTVPLVGLYRLQQDVAHHLSPIPRVLAVAELAACAPFIMQHLNLGEQLIDVCNQLSTHIPVQQLNFKRDPGFWTLIDGH